ncbi:hypothetical protein BBJ28_00021868 [Nothophytophthora sp. Chile5]|nr:hypothetical protein BBJ28_00021868 [Nothophytophthora sp. Chile5]
MFMLQASLYALWAIPLLLAQQSASVSAIVRYDWNVTPYNAVFDGVPVAAYGINDGPAHKAVINVTLGDEVEVHLTNLLDNATCLHWHGLKELGTQDMDGVSGLTQCYIEPNMTAVYRFTPDKAGTFWWHSHESTQYTFGLCGPLIVHNHPDELQPWEQDVDEEITVQLADWYHFLPGSPPHWDTILIDYKGQYNCTAAEMQNLACSEVQPYARFNFSAGKKYRLRLVNEGALAPLLFSIDNHEFRVIAADGEAMQPSELVNTLFINVGQRYDIIVETKESNQLYYDEENVEHPLGSFWMRATGLHDKPWTGFDEDDITDGFNANGLAIIDYAGTTASEPTTESWKTIAMVNEFDFTPMSPSKLPEQPDDRVILEFNMTTGSDPLGWFSINGGDYNNFEIPDEPPLLSIAAGENTKQLPATANAYKLDYGKHIEVVLVNDMNEQHPFHLHSHTPWVVGSGTASRGEITSGNLSRPLRLDGPMLRDVYTVPPCDTDDDGDCKDLGYLVLRLNADSPGVWILHCHIDWHLVDGLAMMFVEGEELLQERGVQAFSSTMLSVCKRDQIDV